MPRTNPRADAGRRVHALAVTGVGGATIYLAARVSELNRFGRPDSRIVFLLGARQAVQGIVTSVLPSPFVFRVGATVDVSHALSMVGLAAASKRFRFIALISGGVAAISAVSAVQVSGRASVRAADPAAARA